MRKDFFTFRRTHKIVLMTNHKPKIPDQTHSIWRRVKLIPFTVQFTGNKEDKNLAEKLKGEYSGILNWLIRGCTDWQQHGLNEPAIITQATAQYRHDEDTFSLFVDECLEQVREYRATRPELRYAYTEWAKRSGEQDLPARILYNRLRQCGFLDIEFRDNGGVPVRGFSGIRVRPLKDPEARLWESVSS